MLLFLQYLESRLLFDHLVFVVFDAVAVLHECVFLFLDFIVQAVNVTGCGFDRFIKGDNL